LLLLHSSMVKKLFITPTTLRSTAHEIVAHVVGRDLLQPENNSLLFMDFVRHLPKLMERFLPMMDVIMRVGPGRTACA